MMKALITGGTTGIGYEIASNLLKRGYDAILVSRNRGEIDNLIKEYPDREIRFISHDLSVEGECYKLLEETEGEDIDVFVSNAGYGDIGTIDKTSLEKEVNMVKLNDIATLILAKSFILRFIKQDRGRVLFVASAASFGAAPYMSLYYATKSFVYSLAQGYYRELRDMRSHVTISILCPGPVKTGFEKRANCKFTIGSISKEKVGAIATSKMLKGKLVIVPGLKMKAAHLFSHFVPKRFISKALNKSAEIKK